MPNPNILKILILIIALMSSIFSANWFTKVYTGEAFPKNKN